MSTESSTYRGMDIIMIFLWGVFEKNRPSDDNVSMHQDDTGLLFSRERMVAVERTFKLLKCLIESHATCERNACYNLFLDRADRMIYITGHSVYQVFKRAEASGRELLRSRLLNAVNTSRKHQIIDRLQVIPLSHTLGVPRWCYSSTMPLSYQPNIILNTHTEQHLSYKCLNVSVIAQSYVERYIVKW